MLGEHIKKDFPIFENNPWLIYLDNAATSQKPKEVIEAITSFYEEYNANVHRGIHTLSERATDAYEKAREKIAAFINAEPEEIIFTKNSTEALNLLAYSLLSSLDKGTIATTVAEHHSNFVPWQQLSRMYGWQFKVLEVDKEGFLDYEKLNEIKPDVFAVTHASNVTGVINDIKKLADIQHSNNKLIVVDGSQAAPHMAIDVKKMDVDAYAFTGHKMLGPTGIGVLYAKKELLEHINPFLYGGDMIESVSIEETTFAHPPYKFEAGTPPIAQAIGLGKAVDYLKRVGMGEIRDHEVSLLKYCIKELDGLVNIVGPKDANKKTGLVSFTIDGIHSHDIAHLLNEKGIAVRSGFHCAEPLHKHLGIDSTTRASFYLYNDKKDIDVLVEGINYIKKVFH